MTDRDRLVRALNNVPWGSGVGQMADALLAAGVTLPPQPAAPVTSEATAEKWLGIRSEDMDSCLTVVEEVRRDMDRILPNLARDHGLLAPAEVERRARDFWTRKGWILASESDLEELVSALTASGTSAASTRTDGGGR